MFVKLYESLRPQIFVTDIHSNDEYGYRNSDGIYILDGSDNEKVCLYGCCAVMLRYL